MSHSRIVRARGTPGMKVSGEVMRAMVYSPDAEREEWIYTELAREHIVVQTARSVDVVVAALVDDPPPRPQILIADFDQITAGELLHLHSVRTQGWFGHIIALGKVPLALRTSLRIDRVLLPPHNRDQLRSLVALAVQHVVNTTRVPRIHG